MNPSDIERLKVQYNLSYHIQYALTAEEKIGLQGKKVLEIGGSLPRSFVLDELGVTQWVAVEEMGYYSEVGVTVEKGRAIPLNSVEDTHSLGDYAIVSGRAENITAAFFEKFDAIFSIAAFEHIDRLPLALSRMHKALKPGGRLFAVFSPIWSAHDGHHLHGVTDKAGNTFSFGSSPIPPWGHLLMRPPQMYRHLLAHTDEDAAADIVYHVYNSPAINRLFTEDYVDCIVNSPFRVDSMVATYLRQPPEDLQQRLQLLHPGRQHFSNNGLMLVLTRS